MKFLNSLIEQFDENEQQKAIKMIDAAVETHQRSDSFDKIADIDGMITYLKGHHADFSPGLEQTVRRILAQEMGLSSDDEDLNQWKDNYNKGLYPEDDADDYREEPDLEMYPGGAAYNDVMGYSDNDDYDYPEEEEYSWDDFEGDDENDDFNWDTNRRENKAMRRQRFGQRQRQRDVSSQRKRKLTPFERSKMKVRDADFEEEEISKYADYEAKWGMKPGTLEKRIKAHKAEKQENRSSSRRRSKIGRRNIRPAGSVLSINFESYLKQTKK